MYFCPACQSSLKAWHVLSAGPLGARRCGQCGQAYFGGGISAAMVVLSVSGYLGGLALLLTGKLYFLWLAPLLGVVPSTWLMVRSQPKRAGRGVKQPAWQWVSRSARIATDGVAGALLSTSQLGAGDLCTRAVAALPIVAE
jgi:hypothetical protein